MKIQFIISCSFTFVNQSNEQKTKTIHLSIIIFRLILIKKKNKYRDLDTHITYIFTDNIKKWIIIFGALRILSKNLIT